MKALIFADLHLHLWRKFGTDIKTGLPRRLKEQLDVADEIGRIIHQEKVDFGINGGDLMHKVGEIPVEVTNFAHSIFDKWGIPIYNVMGNHDTVNRETPKWYESSVDYFQKTYWIERNGPELLAKSNIKLAGINFGCMNEASQSVTGKDIVVVHDIPAGASYGDYKFDEGINWRDLAKKNKFVFFGHIHQNQQLAENCWVVGPPMHLTFGDTGKRGVYIVDTDKDTVKFIEIDAPKFITVDTPDQVKDDKNYYRVLNAPKKMEGQNVVSVIQPKFFEERIKSTEILGVVEEWGKLHDAPQERLTFIKDKLNFISEKTINVMKGRITTVAVKDFGSVGNVQYEINKGAGFTLVSGESDIFSSNGAGKTTMTGDAILWCLFGETTKGVTGDDVIRRGCKDCSVSVTIKDEGMLFFVTRSRSKGLIVDQMTPEGHETELTVGLRQADRQKILEEQVLGFNKTLFMASCYFSQEDILTLTGLGDVGRNNLITELLGFDKYDSLYEICSSEIKKIDDAAIDDEKSIEKIVIQQGTEKTKIDGLNDRIEYYKRETTAVKKKLAETYEEIDKAEKEISQIKKVSVDEEIGKVKALSIGVEDEITAAEEDQERIRVETKGFQTQYYSLNDKKTRLQSELRGSEKMLVESRNRIARLSGDKLGERCDKCGNVVTPESLQSFIDEENKKISDIINTNKPLDEELAKVSAEAKDLDAKQSSGVDKSLNLTARIKELKGELRVYSKETEDLQRKSKEHEIGINVIKGRIKSLQEVIKDKEDSILQYGDEVHEISVGIKSCEDYIEKLQGKINTIKLRLETWKLDRDTAEFWKDAFSPKGIKSLLIDRFCNQFNAIANAYLSEISSGEMSITMSPTATLKSGEERNKLSMDIALDGYVVAYKSLSGGEKRRVDVALCLALNEWVSQRFDISNGLLGLIIFDEIFSFLDRLAEETIGTILYKEGCRKAILVISHTAEMASYAGYRMDVIRKNGISDLKLTNNRGL